MEKDKGRFRMEIKVSVIIAHHFGRLIDRCLFSLYGKNVEIIVVSSDYSHNPKSVKLIHTMDNSPTFKRNEGAKLAKGKYICFFDDDIEVEENCIKDMKDYLEAHPECGMVYALLRKMDNHKVIDTSGSFLSWTGFLNETYVDRQSPIPILSAKSACCMVRKDVFNWLKGFDEDFVIYGEETDLSWRIWSAGYTVMLVPSAVAYHAFETPLKPRSYYNQYYIHYHGCKNYVTTLLKNLPSKKLYIALINASIWSIMGISMWLKGNRQAAKWIFQGLGYVRKNCGYIMFKRRQRVNLKEDFYKDITLNPPLKYYFIRFWEYLTHALHG